MPHYTLLSLLPIEALKQFFNEKKIESTAFEYEIMDSNSESPVFIDPKILLVSIQDIGKIFRKFCKKYIEETSRKITIIITRADLLTRSQSLLLSHYMSHDMYNNLTFIIPIHGLMILHPSILYHTTVKSYPIPIDTPIDRIYGDSKIYNDLMNIIKDANSNWNAERQKELNDVLYQLVLLTVPISLILVRIHSLLEPMLKTDEQRDLLLEIMIINSEYLHSTSKPFIHIQTIFIQILRLIRDLDSDI